MYRKPLTPASISPTLLPDDLIAQNLRQFQRLPVPKGLLFQLIGEVGVAFAPTIFGGTGFHRLPLGIASPNDVGLDLTLHLVYVLSQFSFPPVFSFVFGKSDSFAGEFLNKKPTHQFWGNRCPDRMQVHRFCSFVEDFDQRQRCLLEIAVNLRFASSSSGENIRSICEFLC